MAQVLVRNLDDEVVRRLKQQAALKNRSLEAEVREILAQAAKPTHAELIAEITARRERIGRLAPGAQDAVALIQEGRDEMDRKWERLWNSKR